MYRIVTLLYYVHDYIDHHALACDAICIYPAICRDRILGCLSNNSLFYTVEGNINNR